jgi:hypothetical protein
LSLQLLCRQGREAVQVTYELDVFATDYFEQDGAMPTGDVTRDGSVQSVEIKTTVTGRLHLRLGNVGQISDVKLQNFSTAAFVHSKLHHTFLRRCFCSCGLAL